MKTLLFCMLGLGLTACGSSPKGTNGDQDELAMLIGTYTNGSSKGIYTFRFNQETGTAVPLSSAALPNPSYLVPSEDGEFVYAVSEMNDSTAALSSLAFDRETGELRLLNTVPTFGADPCYVATNGREVLTANYSGGTMSVFPLQKDGTLAPADTLFQGSATGPDAIRQATPHIHCTVFSPDGKYIFATDFSADRILRFVMHPDDPIPHASLEAVDIAADYDVGCLEQIQTITADTVAARGSADIHLSPDGKYLYASNRLKEDGIAIFAVNPENGTLAKVGYQPTGIHPRNFNITPNGKYLLAACRDSNVIQVYKRNEVTGLLEDTHQDIVVDMPVCVQFVSSVNNL